MTTVAYKDGIIASDTRSIYNFGDIEVTLHRVNKAFRTIYGNYIGFSGTVPSDRVLEAIRHEQFDGELPDVNSFMISRGKIYLRNSPTWSHEEGYPFKFIAIGTGAGFAMGAMAAGATAEEAVKIAAKFDRNTGGRVNKLVCEF